MAKLTKTQQKRMVKAILSKAQKLYISPTRHVLNPVVVNTNDMQAIERLCAKWMKRIG